MQLILLHSLFKSEKIRRQTVSSFVISERLADYSKTDVVDVTLWLGGEGETLTTRSLHLADKDFDIEVIDKVRKKIFILPTH